MRARALLFLALALAACVDDAPDPALEHPPTDACGPGGPSDGGCGPPPDARPSDAAPPDGERPDTGLVWAPCTDGDRGDCARVEVPLFWDHPDDDRRIRLRLRRVRAAASARGQLWLLAGGPGGTSRSFEPVDTFRALAPDLDVYLLDHRGAGRSTRLGCSEGEDAFGPGGAAILEQEWPRCLEQLRERWGDALAGFSTTQAAWDLSRLIDGAAVPGQPVFIYGVSYGTWWAHRYLQLFPAQASGVVLDSICPPGGCAVSLYDAGFDEVARMLLEACSRDADCAARLGADAVGRAERLYRRLGEGHCPAVAADGLDPATLRRALAALLTDWSLRAAIPAVVYRFDRCAAGDVAALRVFLGRLRGGGPPGTAMAEPLFSLVLNRHIGLSEMWGDPALDAAELARWEARLLVSTGSSVTSARARPSWPTYPPDRYAGAWAHTDVPMLMMNGSLDPQTPLSIARLAADHFDGPRQRFVRVPGAAHGVIQQAPTRSGTPCGMSLLGAFLRDPDAPPDEACLADLLPVAFTAEPATAEFLFGVPDLWDTPRERAGRDAAPAPPPGWDDVRRAFWESTP